MKVNVSFQFDSPEEAVQFLGRKVLGVPGAPKQPEGVKLAEKLGAEKRGRGRPPKNSAPAQPPSLGSGEKPGNGQKAVPDGTTPPSTPANVAGADSVPAAPAANTPPAAGAQSPGAAGPAVPDEAVNSALQAVLKAKGMNPVTAIFARFGVKRGREVLPVDREKFVAYCAKVAAGEIDPEKGEANPE